MSTEPKKQRLSCPCYALVYATMLPYLQQIAREYGYALAVHGSMATDFDLVAIPWTEEASEPEPMIEALREKLVAHLPVGFNLAGEMQPNPVVKPHGRRAWCFHFDFTHPLDVSTEYGAPYLDISVMPTTSSATVLPIGVDATGPADDIHVDIVTQAVASAIPPAIVALAPDLPGNLVKEVGRVIKRGIRF